MGGKGVPGKECVHIPLPDDLRQRRGGSAGMDDGRAANDANLPAPGLSSFIS